MNKNSSPKAEFLKTPTLTKRLQEIVDLSYHILCNKVAAGSISLPNEASLQMQLGTILNWVGKLYEFDKHDRIVVELESPKEIDTTTKSSNGKARCDIYVTLVHGNSKATAAIELKHLKRSVNEAVTDNRFSVYQDLENLECYKKKEPKLLCYEIVYTDNLNHTVHKPHLTVNIGHGAVADTHVKYTKEREITLKGSYTFGWNIYGNEETPHCFMIIKF